MRNLRTLYCYSCRRHTFASRGVTPDQVNQHEVWRCSECDRSLWHDVSDDEVVAPLVVLDSSELVSHRRFTSPAIDRLIWLAAASKIRLVVPWIVAREVRTQLALVGFSETATFERAVKKMSTERSLGEVGETEWKDALENVARSRKAIAEKLVAEFDEWLQKPGIVVTELEPHHTWRAFDAYFEGHPPYKKPKAREDIPDSFVLESVRDLVERGHDVHFIARDNGLRTGASSLKKLNTYEGAPQFLASVFVKSLLDDVEAMNAEILRGLFDDHFEETIQVLLSELEVKTQDLKVDRGLPEGSDPAIDYISLKTLVRARPTDLEYWGGGAFGIRVTVGGEAHVSYSMDKYDWMVAVEEYGRDISVAALNEHTFWAQEFMECSVDVVVVLQVPEEEIQDESLGMSGLVELAAKAKWEVESIEQVRVIDPGSRMKV